MDSVYLDREIKNERRLHNIDVFSKLDRTGLKYGEKERRLLLYRTKIGEDIYIQYPGKETKAKKVKPWDFRPKLVNSAGMLMKDMSFKDIWDNLFEYANNRHALINLAAVFARMAYMYDHKLYNSNFNYYDYNCLDGMITEQGTIPLNLYILNCESYLQEISIEIPYINGVSLEGYLVYNDLLAANEDCKYYYREEIEKNENKGENEKKNKWDKKIGGTNTLLTHLSVIQYIFGQIHFTSIVDKFMRGYGVAPLPLGDIEEITFGLCKAK